MDINVEGIEAVSHLLERIQRLQDELTGLKNRLRLYESPS
jgi:PleD family two-component response regulator